MATRTKSGSSGPRTSAAKSATPGPSASTPSGQQSPTRYSRIHEKEELSNLNDRLATYIDKVRSLEVENSRLTREVRTREETVTREVNSVKKLYEAELNEARKLLDDVSKDKTRLELDCKRLYDASEELRGHLEAKSADASRFQAELSLRERELNDLSTKFNQAQSDKKRLAEEVKNLTKKNQKLEPQCAELLKKAEKETLERINAETELTTLREELEFKESVFQQQLMEVRTKKLVEISEIDGRLSQKYEEKMLASLQEIRDEFEIDLEVKNEEVKRLYEEKLRSLESQLARSSQSSSMALDELRSMTKKIDELARKLSQAEAEKDDAVRKTREYEKDLDATKSRYINEFAKYDAEVTRLRQEMASQMQEYQELMEIKVALDMEIAAYRKLLEGEEERLHITPVATPRTPRSAGRGAKRKRTAFEESEESTDVSVSTSASGDIHIVEEDKSGKFIKLQNKGTSAVALTGWTLNRKVDDRSTVYKFTRAVKLEPGATVTVWSADAGHAAEPPVHVVIKKDSWPFGDVQTTSLVTNAGEEVATSESKRVQRSSSSSWSSGQFTSEFRRGAAKPDDKCCVM